jgi:hypothetical protein
MKIKQSIALTACLVSMALVTGCGGGDGGGQKGNSPSSLQGRTMSVQVTGGSSPFASSGSYIFTPAGDGHSGSYTLQGSGGVQSNVGSYTYNKTGDSTATLVETEQSGTQVQNTLSFGSPNSGTIHSSSSNVGGSQDGNFTLN